MTDAPELPTETTLQGEQIVAPGVKPITLRDRLAVRAAQPIAPRRTPNAQQKPCDIGLFDGEAGKKKVRWTFFPLNARNQLDMLDLIRAARREAPNPEHSKES